MPASSPQERSMIGRIAAESSWSRTDDRAARTAPARRAMLDRFEREVDPDGELTPAERNRRASHARKAYFTRLALKSAQSRRKAREFTTVAEQAEAELRAGGDPPRPQTSLNPPVPETVAARGTGSSLRPVTSEGTVR